MLLPWEDGGDADFRGSKKRLKGDLKAGASKDSKTPAGE